MTPDQAEDVLVALPHLRLILGALNEAGAKYEQPDESAALGLARVRLPSPPLAAEALEQWQRSAGPGSTGSFHGRPPPEATDARSLDRILWSLRAGFSIRYAGWTPTIGKNRPVASVVGEEDSGPGVAGAGEVSHGGGGAPRAVTSHQPWAATREAAPGNGIHVGIVDTPIQSHRYLSGAWVGRYSDRLADTTGPSYAEAGHATFVCGLVLQHAPGAALHVRRLLDDRGRADSWIAAQEIVEAGRAGIDVLNLSFVCYTDDSEAPMALSAAIDRLSPDIVVVAAAGNHGFLRDGREYKPAWPAALDDVIAVGASKEHGEHTPADFTPKGPWIDVLAPGENLVSTYLKGGVLVWNDDASEPNRHEQAFSGYARWSGTSFSAAGVSGELAARARPGRLTAREACDEMLETAREEQRKRGLPEDPVYLHPGQFGRDRR